MDSLHENTAFNDEAKFLLVRNAVMEHLKLAQFAIYGGAKTYRDLSSAIMDFWSDRCAFQAAANILRSSRYNSLGLLRDYTTQQVT